MLLNNNALTTLNQVSETDPPGDGTPDKPGSVEKTEKGYNLLLLFLT